MTRRQAIRRSRQRDGCLDRAATGRGVQQRKYHRRVPKQSPDIASVRRASSTVDSCDSQPQCSRQPSPCPLARGALEVTGLQIGAVKR